MISAATFKYFIELFAVLLLALGIKGLSKVSSARKANRLASVAMALAAVGVLVSSLGGGGISPESWVWIIIGSGVGGLLGALTAQRVPMTAMPETVALFNGCGGMSSLLVAIGVALFPLEGSDALEKSFIESISIIISVFVGAITFSGSIVAMAKLQGWLSTPHWMQSKLRHGINIVFVVMSLVAAFELYRGGNTGLWLLVISSAFLGIGVTMPIGGADMPVVISLLNSYSGVAAAAAGFVMKSQLLIVAGAMVGAAGLILTQVMCKGMNRSLLSVLFGGALGVATSQEGNASNEYVNITSCTVEECALTMEAAERVVVVPGYGLAVAQAQHTLREVTRVLEAGGIEVSYAIHPVAGRMPGHMNVLLAEADVPYDQLKEMDVINPDFPATDVVLVLGANDVVNPQAKNDPTSPLYGMPVLDVQEARTVFVVKRGMSAGYSGIKNDLFELQNTSMVFGDAKKVLGDLLVELKELGVSGKG